MFHETPKHARTDPTLAFLSYVLYHSWPTMKKIALSLFLPVQVYGIQGDLISVTLYSMLYICIRDDNMPHDEHLGLSNKKSSLHKLF